MFGAVFYCIGDCVLIAFLIGLIYYKSYSPALVQYRDGSCRFFGCNVLWKIVLEFQGGLIFQGVLRGWILYFVWRCFTVLVIVYLFLIAWFDLLQVLLASALSISKRKLSLLWLQRAAENCPEISGGIFSRGSSGGILYVVWGGVLMY